MALVVAVAASLLVVVVFERVPGAWTKGVQMMRLEVYQASLEIEA